MQNKSLFLSIGRKLPLKMLPFQFIKTLGNEDPHSFLNIKTWIYSKWKQTEIDQLCQK